MITRLKKSIAVFVTFIMLIVTICTDYHDNIYQWTVSAETIISGDLNKDGCIDVRDLTLYKRAILNDSPLDKNIADLNGDGYADINDVNQMLEYLLCKRTHFPSNIFYETKFDMLKTVNSIKNNLSSVDQSIIDNGEPIENCISQDMAEWIDQFDSPIGVYNYIYNSIETEFYPDSRKGAIGTFQQNGGNDLDIASLLIAALRYMGYEANYVYGKIKLTPEQAMNWTGANDVDTAIDILNIQGGKSVTRLLNSNKQLSSISLYHYWVEATIPTLLISGNSKELTTVFLDASYKEHSVDASYYAELTKAGISDINTDIINSDALQQISETITGIAQSSLNMFGRTIVQSEHSKLPNDLPYIVMGTVEKITEVDIGHSDSLTIQINGTSLAQIKTADLYNKRLTLEYEFTDQAKEKIKSMSNPPKSILDINDTHTSNGITIQPILKLDGIVLEKGPSTKIADNQKLSIINHTCQNNVVIENIITAGSMYSIVTDTQNISAHELIKAVQNVESSIPNAKSFESAYNDNCMGAYLDAVGKQYLSNVDTVDSNLRDRYSVYSEKMTNICIVSFNLDFTITESLVHSSVDIAHKGTMGLDADFLSVSALSLKGSLDELQNYILARGLMTSMFESSVLEECTGIESVSTTKVLEIASNQNIPIVKISKKESDYNKVLDSLHVTDSTKADICSYVEAGYTVLTPVNDVTINSWTGTGYIIVEDSGTCTYMLSNHTAGGETTYSIENLEEGLDTLVLTLYIAAVVLATIAFVVALFAFAGPVIGALTGALAALPEGFVGLAATLVLSTASLSGSVQSLNNFLEGEETTADKVVAGVSSSYSIGKLIFWWIVNGKPSI